TASSALSRSSACSSDRLDVLDTGQGLDAVHDQVEPFGESLQVLDRVRRNVGRLGGNASQAVGRRDRPRRGGPQTVGGAHSSLLPTGWPFPLGVNNCGCSASPSISPTRSS